MKDSLARLKVTLPNRYCSLPIQHWCEARNACLDCSSYFVTTPDFLPVHQDQRDATVSLLASATAAGSERIAEKNRQGLIKLDAIIASLSAVSEGAS